MILCMAQTIIPIGLWQHLISLSTLHKVSSLFNCTIFTINAMCEMDI